MENQAMVERPLMGQEEYEKYLEEKIQEDKNSGTPHLKYFEAVNRYRSVGRAYRRGLITKAGIMTPNRPFNNRKTTLGRKKNELKKHIYGEYSRFLERAEQRAAEAV